MTTAELVIYYQQLLIMEYYGLSNATGMIGAFVTQAVADLIVMQVRSAFALGTAIGKQLDALGEIVGVQRQIAGFTPGTPEFAMPRYSDGAAGSYIGFARYAGIQPNGHWARYTDQPTAYIMTDGQLTQLIQFLVAVRASDYSLEELDDIFFSFFGTLVTITDNLNMTMTYTHNATLDTGVLFDIINYLGYLPHPAGVAYNVVSI